MISSVFSIALGPVPLPVAAEGSSATATVLPGIGREASEATSRVIRRRWAFTSGPENALVQTVAEAVMRGEPDFSPLVFCGPTGTGKSLLLRGLAAAVSERCQERVLVTTGADFARELKTAFEVQAVEDFRSKYRQAGMLAIDDLQGLGGKTAAQQELIATLDALHERDALCLVASSPPPLENSSLLAQLASRLAGGLTVPLQPPETPARYEILRRLVELYELPMPEPLIRLLVEGEDQTPSPLRSVPQLQHAVLQLSLQRTEQSGDLATEHVQQFLDRFRQHRSPTLKSISTAVCRHFQLKLAELKGPTRRQQVVYSRSIAMLLARNLTTLSLKQIGDYFGRDHTTVLHACRKTSQLCQSDAATRQIVRELTEQVSP